MTDLFFLSNKVLLTALESNLRCIVYLEKCNDDIRKELGKRCEKKK